MAYMTIQTQTDPRGVLTITLNRPDVRNAFNEALIQELTQVFKTEVAAPATRAVVLRGNGPAFCAGGDLNWMKKAASLSQAENLEDTRKLTSMFALMNESPKPVIGLVHGAAIGGGVGLVSICDIVIAEKETVFSLSEVRLGLVPACIGPFVIPKIGPSHARALFISAERFKAPHAREVGLVHEVVSGEAALQSACDRVLGNILQCGPNAMSVAKQLILNLTAAERRAKIADCQEYVSKTLAELRVSPEGQEGVRAFLEKRRPSWMK